MKHFLPCTLMCALVVPSAFAASLWDGTWKLDRSKSHLTGDSFTYSKTGDGMWLITAGQVKIPFAPDGKPYPVLDPDHTMIATMNGDHGMTFVDQFKGKTTSTMKETLSADGSTLTDESTGVHADGSTYTSSETSKHVGPGTGFLGKWVSTKEKSSTEGTIVISTAADGMVSLSYPMSKETVVGKHDGTPLPINGPRVPAGVTIAYKVVSPVRVDYKVTLNSKPVAEGYEMLAADGKSFADTSWPPGQMAEKTTAVYVKQ
jgi:hypothetical protein